MPGDTKPHVARQAKRHVRRPKPGTVRQLTAVLWRAITHLETHLDRVASADKVDTSELCKLTHATAQAAGVYLKAIEVGELEARLEAVERAQENAQLTRWAA
jgi:transcriptional regulator of aromatic amino acid metabolism